MSGSEPSFVKGMNLTHNQSTTRPYERKAKKAFLPVSISSFSPYPYHLLLFSIISPIFRGVYFKISKKSRPRPRPRLHPKTKTKTKTGKNPRKVLSQDSRPRVLEVSIDGYRLKKFSLIVKCILNWE